MVKKQVPKKRRPKTAKKKFFSVSIPLTSTKAQLYGYSPEEIEGSMIKLDLTRNLRGKNLELRAKVKLSSDNEELTSETISLKLAQTYIKKATRKGTDYVEDSFILNCKNAKLRIKPLLVTRKRVSRSVQKALRNAAKKQIESKVKIRTTEELFSEVMANKFQKELSMKLKKIYPLALCEIRVIEILEKIENPKDNKKEKQLDKQ